jgi:hypothetical protein
VGQRDQFPISADDVGVGLQAARREVDDGLYRSRWDHATPAQRDLLRALADLAGDATATASALASRMHKSRVSDLSVTRNELIKKGLVYAAERGMLTFPVPGITSSSFARTGTKSTRRALTPPPSASP